MEPHQKELLDRILFSIPAGILIALVPWAYSRIKLALTPARKWTWVGIMLVCLIAFLIYGHYVVSNKIQWAPKDSAPLSTTPPTN